MHDTVLRMNLTLGRRMLPVTLFMVVLMVLGVLGNLAVVVVFLVKKNKSTPNYFMLSLGCVDLVR